MRLFIGIDLPSEIKSKIADSFQSVQDVLGAKGWENPHDYHQTLLFIGETAEEVIPSITNRLDEINFAPFEMQVRGVSFFNRRIMFVDFYPSVELLELKKAVDLKFPEYLRPNEKEFIPHMTIKRWQRYEFDRLNEEVFKRPLPSIFFPVNALSLFKSERDEHNLKYHVIHQSKFPSVK